MMASHLGPGACAAFLLLVAPAFAEPVDVSQGDSNGSGYGFRRGDTCLVVTAGHVVPESGVDVTVTDRTGGKATGQRVYYNTSKAEDLALIELPARSAVNCNDRWPDADEVAGSQATANTSYEVTRHYPTGRESVVRLRGAGGTPQLLTLAFEDKLKIIQSDSGSIVRSQGRYAGIVVSVRAAEDRVDVLRFDVIDRLVGARFRTVVRGVPVRLEGVAQRGRLNPNWTTYVASWLTETGGHRVVDAGDAAARCRISVDVIEWARTRTDNPQYEAFEGRLRSCSEGTKLALPIPIQLKPSSKDRSSCEREVRQEMRGVPRQLPSHKLTLNVKITPRNGPAVSKLQTTEHVEDGERGARAEVELVALQQSFAQVAGELFKDGACQ